jgi:NAD(P)-dependent dehydrogenase (short-subunit alcohol dehydrogenase family)
MDLGMKGRAYAIVGGSRGMGLETSRRLAEEGARVAIISRAPDEAADTLARAHGIEVRGFSADVSVPGAIEAALEGAASALGPLRGLAVTNHWTGPSPIRNGMTISSIA